MAGLNHAPAGSLLHYPPHNGREKTMNSLKLFAERVIPAFRPQRTTAAAS